MSTRSQTTAMTVENARLAFSPQCNAKNPTHLVHTAFHQPMQTDIRAKRSLAHAHGVWNDTLDDAFGGQRVFTRCRLVDT